MVEVNTDQDQEAKAAEQSALANKLGGAGWALFVIWIGVALLLNVGTGVTLLGIGAITLGMQLVRRSQALSLEVFWVVVGALFLLAGLWALSGTELPLLPILLIVAGAVGLFSLFRR
jgi:ABC-type uncharacterized transport system permease subunit